MRKIVFFALGALFVVVALTASAEASTCSNTLVSTGAMGNGSASIVDQLPRVEDMVLRSETTQPLLGAYTKTRFPQIFFSRYKWEYLQGPPLVLVRRYLDRNNQTVWIREVPELGLTEILWRQRVDTLSSLLGEDYYTSMSAFRLSDGSLFVGKFYEIKIEADATNPISDIKIIGCVEGKTSVLRTIPLPRPVRFDEKKKFYNYGLSCKTLKKPN